MPDREGSDSGRQGFQVTYHGESPDDHSLDVEALAPALLGFGRLIRESNALLNGDKTRVKILVTSDFEHRCFQINFEVLQTAIQKLKSFLEDDRVKTKELLQTIGVIRSSGAGSLLDYLKWKRNKPAEKIEVLPAPTPTSPSLITIQITGDRNTITITPEVLRLAESSRVLEAVKEALTPIDLNEAARIEFRDHDQPVASINSDEARDIVREIDDVPEALTVVEEQPSPDTVVATLYVYSPVFDEKAKRWRFVYKRNKHIYADISETSIAADAMKRGGSFVNDRYRVRMEVTPPEADDGEPHYKILAVLEFTPAPQQGSLALPKPRTTKKAATKRK